MTTQSPPSDPDEALDAVRRVGGGAHSEPHSDELARRRPTASVREVIPTALRHGADLGSLVAAWKTETDPTVRVALASALVDVVSDTQDTASVTALLSASDCPDSLRSEIARRTRHAECRRIAIASIQDHSTLIVLARNAEQAETRQSAAERVRVHRLRETAELADDAESMARQRAADRVTRYVPRILQQHLLEDAARRSWVEDGSAAFVDVSGFTMLSEQLARKGREGAEQITDVIGECFESILEVAYDHGGSLLKFGGDALLLWFAGEAHAMRSCRAAILMRRVLNEVGRIELPGATVTLRMSQGVHSGRFHFFAVGSSHVELLPVGPGWSRLVANQHAADAGEIVVSAQTAALLPADCLGAPKEPGVVLVREPSGHEGKMPRVPRPKMPIEAVAHCLSPPVRAHVVEGAVTSEHRPVTIAFLRFEATDALIGQGDAAAAAEALHRLVTVVELATLRRDLALLASDVDADGGKLILTAGAPKVTGDDEERMLLALREIVSADLPFPVRIGVHRGAVFAGDIGPEYRRTYTVMGDAVNLAARLMAAAGPGEIYATADVLERSDTLFATTGLPPLPVKGKAQPALAWSVGEAVGSRTRNVSLQQLPLIGRNAELGILRKALGGARSGAGRLIEIVGDPGVGKTRLLEALRGAAMGFRKLHAVCEAYTASLPYAAWRELLRELMEIRREDPDSLVVERLRDAVATKAPDLAPWLPLLAGAFDVEVESTPEVEMLAERNRSTKLHECVGRFLEVMLPGPALIEIENAHHMNEASAELLSDLTSKLDGRPWLFGVARRRSDLGFSAPAAPAVIRIDLTPVAAQDAVRMAELASEQTPVPRHVLEVVAQRSGGNPQFLRDLLRSAIDSGGIASLPDSAEAAAMARIDALAPEDRALIRRAAVFGLTFHPRMLAWFADGDDPYHVAPASWTRLQAFFEDDGGGYLRFRHSLLRDAAYEGLPYKLRRRLHGAVAARLEAESDEPDDFADILSFHYFTAGEHEPAFRYANVAAKRAEGVYAYVAAAGLYARAVDAARALPEVSPKDLAAVHESLADAWNNAGEFRKAGDAYAAARQLIEGDPLAEACLLLKSSRLEEKLGQYPEALRLAERARERVQGLPEPKAARLSAECAAWYATVLQAQGRTTDAMEWAQRTVVEAEAADDPDALGAAYFVLAWAYGALGKAGGEAHMQRSLKAYHRSGNRVRQAAILANLGVICQWEGRWDDAMAYYERGRDESLKLGNTVNAGVARMNVAEILADRGELAEAEMLLQQTLPLWKASEYRYFLGGCLWLLGRVALRAGRFEEALSRLEQARTDFLHVGAEQEVIDVDARIAECRIHLAHTDAALKCAEETLAKVGDGNGEAKLVPLLQRVRAYALLQQGDPFTARDALDASLEAGRERKDLFEIALTLLALIELDRLEGIEPPHEVVTESRSLLSQLKVRAVPPLPRLAQ